VLSLTLERLGLSDRQMRVLGKGNKERVLPLPEVVSRAIDLYLSRERPVSCLSQSLFVVLQGKRRGYPMTSSGLRSLFRSRRRATEITRANPHRFRHCFGTEMARAGVGVPVLQKMLGHADERMSQRYIHLSMSDVAHEFNRAIEKLNERYGLG
jgi:site-specific recombinase XerD